MKIACPKCDFRPTPNLLWRCHPGCGYAWHTFATHGICPRCSKMWHDTQCPTGTLRSPTGMLRNPTGMLRNPRCRMWSPIDDWYRDDVPERQRTVKREQPGLLKVET